MWRAVLPGPGPESADAPWLPGLTLVVNDNLSKLGHGTAALTFLYNHFRKTGSRNQGLPPILGKVHSQ